MKKIVIIGAGFAGITTAAGLARRNKDWELFLIDKKSRFNFLPLLPDVIGRGIDPKHLENPLSDFQKTYGFKLLLQSVETVDLAKKKVVTAETRLDYDYLVIASGSETNFYGNQGIKKYAYSLDDSEDARKIRVSLERNKHENFIIAGGGYTGIEVATNLRKLFDRLKQRKRIIIVERAESLLGPLPKILKDYTLANLQKLNIEIFYGTVVDKADKDEITLSNGASFKAAMLIWTAGVKTAGFIDKLEVKKVGPGRIIVDKDLRFNGCAFAIGDAAAFIYQDKPLRMAVQFAVSQAQTAARNIFSLSANRQLQEFRPMDLGYIVPMANNQSCGVVFGRFLFGKLPTMLHYLMCGYRSYGFKNKLGLLKELTSPLKAGKKHV